MDVLDRTSNLRDVVLFKLAFATGLRASELLSIRREHVCFQTRSIWIKAKKRGKDRRLPLSSGIFLSLSHYIDTLTDCLLFPISYQRLCQLWHFYRPVKKSFHSLRHTRAVYAYQLTRDPKLVQELLGHRDIRNTMVYLDYSYDLETIRGVCG